MTHPNESSTGVMVYQITDRVALKKRKNTKEEFALTIQDTSNSKATRLF